MESWFDFKIPKNWKRTEAKGWMIEDNIHIQNSKDFSPETQLLTATLFGFGHPSELEGLRNTDIDSNFYDMASRQLRLNDSRKRILSGSPTGNGYHRIELYDQSKGPEFIFKRLSDGSRLKVYSYYHLLTKEAIFVPTASKGDEELFSIQHADKVSFDDMIHLVDTTNTFNDFKSEQNKFEARFPKQPVRTLTRESLESLIQKISGKVDYSIITQVDAIIRNITGINFDLNAHSRNVASRVFFPDGSAIFKICEDDCSAEREIALITAAQADPYLAPFIPKLLDTTLYKYKGTSMFILQDRRHSSELIPSYVQDHFSYVNEHNPSLKTKLSSQADFKTYLTALFHWRGRIIKNALPQALFTSSYLTFPEIKSRMGNFRNSQIQSKFNYLSGFYPEAVDVLEHATYTTVLHRDMKPENIVFNHNKDSKVIPMSIVDFGDASMGPGIFDIVRHFNDKLLSPLPLSEYDRNIQRQIKLYLAFMNSFSNLGKVDSSEFYSTLNLFRASATVDYTKFGSWCISHGISSSSSTNNTLAQSAITLAYHNAKIINSKP